MLLASGTRLGTYEIVGRLAAGGMGEVYRAKDLRLGREVALKVLPESVARDADHLARFEREARIVAGLNHPYIVTLFSVDDEDGVRFLTMELVEGESLSDLVGAGRLPLDRVLEIAVSIGEAITAAHETGVVHRDLKPGNVMVTREGRVKVLDFGLAKRASEASGSSTTTTEACLTQAGDTFGTVPYMSPEQIRAGHVDARADLFSFGVLLYELIAAHRPFVGPTSLAVSAAILNEDPEPLSKNRSDLPEGLEHLVFRCLEKRPERRFQNARDLVEELRRVRRNREATQRNEGTSVASIAVLPFVNRSHAEEDEYFSDGLADELLNVLAKIQGLRVAARSSAFQFRNKNVTASEVGSALHVATVLEGSVRKAGNRVRIAVQLVKASDGFHMWSEVYDRTLDDIFAVQDDIAQSVVKELRATVLGSASNSEAVKQDAQTEVARAARGRGSDAEAHRLALQGRHMIERLTRDDVFRGIQYLQQALRLDPGHALAWVDLARAHNTAAGIGWENVREGALEARHAVERALAIEPDLPEAHNLLGRIQLYFEWDWKGAAESYRRARELAPGIAAGHHGAGLLAQNEGRWDEALDLYRRAVDQDPLSAAAYHRLGIGCLAAGLLEEAEFACRRAVELAPQRVSGHATLGIALLARGRLTEALEETKKESEPVYRLRALAATHHALGQSVDSDAALNALIQQLSKGSAFQIAEAYASRGENDRAFAWLERARAQHDPGIAESTSSYLLKSLHPDPRWDAFLKSVGILA